MGIHISGESRMAIWVVYVNSFRVNYDFKAVFFVFKHEVWGKMRLLTD